MLCQLIDSKQRVARKLVFVFAVYNMEGHIYFGASTEQERDSWVHAFTRASIENLKRTAEELRARLALAQDASLPPIAQSNGDESEQLLIIFD